MVTGVPMFASSRRTTMTAVSDTFDQWKAAREAIELLEAKIGLCPDDATPGLLQMEAELRQLRADSDRLLSKAQQALLSVKTPRVSQLDPTLY